MNDFLICLIIWLMLSMVLIIYPASNYPDKLRNFSVGQLITLVLFLPGFLFWTCFEKLIPFFKSKPFKKARFKVGEEVLYKGVDKGIILKNEKSFDSDEVQIQLTGTPKGYTVTTNISNVTKLSPLEKAMK